MNDSYALDDTGRMISSDKVTGTTVYNAEGEKLGSVHNFMVDKRSGRVDYAVLQFGGLFGIGSDYYPIPWAKLSYSPDMGGYVVDLDKSQLENAPRHGEEMPPYDSDYDAEIQGHYGVKPFI
jgi:sporulation protein YlmC with PRC-barrel domain